MIILEVQREREILYKTNYQGQLGCGSNEYLVIGRGFDSGRLKWVKKGSRWVNLGRN